MRSGVRILAVPFEARRRDDVGDPRALQRVKDGGRGPQHALAALALVPRQRRVARPLFQDRRRLAQPVDDRRMVRQDEGAEQLRQRTQSAPLVVGEHRDGAVVRDDAFTSDRHFHAQQSVEPLAQSGEERRRELQGGRGGLDARARAEGGETKDEGLGEGGLGGDPHDDVAQLDRASILEDHPLERRDPVLLHREVEAGVELQFDAQRHRRRQRGRSGLGIGRVNVGRVGHATKRPPNTRCRRNI
jgi:hypothetical protein